MVTTQVKANTENNLQEGFYQFQGRQEQQDEQHADMLPLLSLPSSSHHSQA